MYDRDERKEKHYKAQERRDMMSVNMRIRKIKNGEFSFPGEWLELNPEEAKDKCMVVFICEKNRCAVYYSKKCF